MVIHLIFTIRYYGIKLSLCKQLLMLFWCNLFIYLFIYLITLWFVFLHHQTITEINGLCVISG